MSNTYQKNRRRAQPGPLPDEIAVPDQVIVAMAEIAGAAKEGLLALAVSTGLQVMTAMFDEDVTRLRGPDGKHNPGRAGYRHGTEAGSVTLVRVVEKARAKAPAARILLVDYLTVLDEDSGPATPFSDEEISQLLLLQAATARVFKDAARRARPELILASSLSSGHALGSPEPWVQPFYPFTEQAGASLQQAMMHTGASFHPNEVGMAAIAAELERVLTS